MPEENNLHLPNEKTSGIAAAAKGAMVKHNYIYNRRTIRRGIFPSPFFTALFAAVNIFGEGNIKRRTQKRQSQHGAAGGKCETTKTGAIAKRRGGRTTRKDRGRRGEKNKTVRRAEKHGLPSGKGRITISVSAGKSGRAMRQCVFPRFPRVAGQKQGALCGKAFFRVSPVWQDKSGSAKGKITKRISAYCGRVVKTRNKRGVSCKRY